MRKLWDGSDWGDGYADNRGRFRVYRPDFPRAYALGYALRAHVVYWLAHGEPHPKGTDLHHLNGDKLDDRLQNLEVIGHSTHAKLHNPQRPVTKRCECCGEEFTRRRKPHQRFCSQSCGIKGSRWTDR